MEDLPAVIPLLVYRDIEGAHRFLVDAFRFEPGIIVRDADGNVHHGEVHHDGQVIWLHRVFPERGFLSPEDVPASTGELVVRVDDVDQHCEHARSAGAEIEYEPADQDYGVREYGARDHEGHRWAFVTALA
ncbi:MAG: VOC family protein [Solirubrobacteraceae bacterium]